MIAARIGYVENDIPCQDRPDSYAFSVPHHAASGQPHVMLVHAHTHTHTHTRTRTHTHECSLHHASKIMMLFVMPSETIKS